MKRIPLLARLTYVCIVMVMSQAGFSAEAPATFTPKYDDLISTGHAFLKEDKLSEAYVAAMEAGKLDKNRFESYALAGLVLARQNQPAEALKFIKEALTRAPDAKKSKLAELQQTLEQAAQSVPPGTSAPNTKDLSAEARRRYDALMVIIEDADAAKNAEERTRLLTEFLDKSPPYLETNPKDVKLWIERASAALELERPKVAWHAGRQLEALGIANSEDPKIRKVMARLERKGWLTQSESDIDNLQTDADQLVIKITLTKQAIREANDQITAMSADLDKSSVEDSFKQSCREGMAMWKAYAEVKQANLDELQRYSVSGRTVAYDRIAYQLKLCHVPRRRMYSGMIKSTLDQGKVDFDALKKEADAGDRDAEFALSSHYRGTNDLAQWLSWSRKAAEHGHALGMFSSGLGYRRGEGVAKDDAEATKWFQRSSGRGFGPASQKVAEAYELGAGVPKDSVTALRYYRQAVDQGFEDAKADVQRLEKTTSR